MPDPNCFGGTDRDRHGREGLARTADRASLCRRQLPHHRRRRHGACDPHEPAASAPAANSPSTSSRSWRRSRRPPTQGSHVTIETRPERPAMLPTDLPRSDRLGDASIGTAGSLKMREALIVWGGWSGHEPEQGAAIVAGMLEEDGFKVYVENTTEAFADPAMPGLSLIVPIYTMSKIEKEELDNLTKAVRGGVGLGGYHGGMCDAFREAGRLPVHVRRPVGRPSRQHHRLPRRHHPARTIRSCRGSATSPTAPSSTTCTSIPRTRCWRRRPSPASMRRGSRASSCRWCGSARTAKGRVFYSSLGHVAKEFEVPEMATILRRGLLWAAR